MKLRSIDGKVPYIMAAGKDFVKDEMSLTAAEQICSRGTQTASKLEPRQSPSPASLRPIARAEIFNLPVVRHHCRSPLSEITHG